MIFVNKTFEDFADCFVGALIRNDDIAFPEELNRDQLTFSVKSLKHVDDYLTYLFENRPERMGRDWVNTILWGGAYVGEIIRRNSVRPYNWVDFDDWIREYPEQVKILGDRRDLQVCAFLTPGKGAFTLPLNKVHKFIENGQEDSVQFYAECEVRAKM